MNKTDRQYFCAVMITIVLIAGSVYFGVLVGTHNHAISVLQPYLFLLGVPFSLVAGVMYLINVDKIENWLRNNIAYIIGAGFGLAIVGMVFNIMFGS